MFNINNYLEQINCPICYKNDYTILKNSNYEKIYNLDSLLSIYKSSADELMLDQLVVCNNCNFSYLNPRIKSEIIYKSYSDNIDEKHVSQDRMRYKTFKNSLLKIIDANRIPLETKKTFLDIGSASGIFLKVAKDLGFEETGFEPSNWMVKYGENKYNVNIHQGTVEDVKYFKYDYISFWDVLEHVTNLKQTLEKVDELSKKNTILIINVPDIDSYVSKIMGFRWPFYLNVHLYYFRKKNLQEVLKNYNFELIKSFPHWQFLQLGYLLERAGKYFSFFLTLKKLADYSRLSKLSVPYNMGQTTFVFKKQ